MLSKLENILVNSYKDRKVEYVNSHPDCFEELIKLAISEKQPFSWRSAWLIWNCMENNDKRIKPYINKIINSLNRKEDGHQRELIKVLSQMKLTNTQEGHLFNISANIWEQLNKQSSVRFYALKFIFSMAKKYPELENEIQCFTKDHYIKSLSPGIKNSIQKLLKEINK